MGEEVGVEPINLKKLRSGVNMYHRYCHLFAGESDEKPSYNLNPDEVNWAGYFSPELLHAMEETHELIFVEGFFEDLNLALEAKAARTKAE